MWVPTAALFLGAFTLAATRCPTGTVQGPSVRDCYIYVNEAALWFSAEERCINKGGHLASISGAIVNSFLAAPAAKNCSPEYWIGGAWNLGVPNAWVWTEGRPFRYTHWAQGQPQQTDNTQCLAYDARTNLWYGGACNLYRPYVCRVPAISNEDPYERGTTSAECNCLTSPPKAPTTHAAADCTTAEEERVCPTTSNWSFWTCPTASTFVTEERSTSARSHVTPTLAPDYCPAGWTYGPWTHKCYFKRRNENIEANWTWTDAFCKGIGAEMVSIHSLEENVWLSAFLNDRYGNSAFIGLYKDDHSQWKWSDGSPFEYTHWMPDMDCGNRAYASLASIFEPSAYPSICWNCDDGWRVFYVALCQKDAEPSGKLPKPTLPTPTSLHGSCPTDWVYSPWSQKCYHTNFASKSQNWTWYLSYCKDLGAELPSIHSDFENLWLTGESAMQKLIIAEYRFCAIAAELVR
ncbi:CLEC-50 protein [Aphelenchoides avenae]|nr:CLEC-50 protein [Aphelenchus avenae]